VATNTLFKGNWQVLQCEKLFFAKTKHQSKAGSTGLLLKYFYQK
jgi:hypothetical protein